MNPGRYFVPNMGMRFMNQGVINNGYSMPGRLGLFDRISQGIKSFNWGGLLDGANKTLNVVNQTIPLIRQTRPMVGNVKNMVRLVRAFRNETGNKNKNVTENNIAQKKEVFNDNHPNFFI